MRTSGRDIVEGEEAAHPPIGPVLADRTVLLQPDVSQPQLPAYPEVSQQSVAAHQSALLSLTGLLPDSKLDFNAPTVTLGWRVFAPDPAAPFLRVQPTAGTGHADWLPLVCRGTDQFLLLVLASPDVEAITVEKMASARSCAMCRPEAWTPARR